MQGCMSSRVFFLYALQICFLKIGCMWGNQAHLYGYVFKQVIINIQNMIFQVIPVELELWAKCRPSRPDRSHCTGYRAAAKMFSLVMDSHWLYSMELFYLEWSSKQSIKIQKCAAQKISINEHYGNYMLTVFLLFQSCKLKYCEIYTT